jgi:predicted nucleic acid-binding protein
MCIRLSPIIGCSHDTTIVNTSGDFDLALEYELTGYDASYAVLAQQLSLPLITADATLKRKLSGSGLDVRLL